MGRSHSARLLRTELLTRLHANTLTPDEREALNLILRKHTILKGVLGGLGSGLLLTRLLPFYIAAARNSTFQALRGPITSGLALSGLLLGLSQVNASRKEVLKRLVDPDLDISSNVRDYARQLVAELYGNNQNFPIASKHEDRREREDGNPVDYGVDWRDEPPDTMEMQEHKTAAEVRADRARQRRMRWKEREQK